MSRIRCVALVVGLVGMAYGCPELQAQMQCVSGGGMGMGGDPYAAAVSGPQPRAYGKTWGSGYGAGDWNRFYHYPYVYYPQNFWGNEYYKSADSLYYRYPTEMRIPVYNRKWHNYYPSPRPYHRGHHFILDVF